ncbi:hypothetical protein [Undibacterium sp. Ji49W]|uniref:hypothetical protein n=1 Tax=Undibacterium sp. Ji49W TaxID=3413040 RepID=UPI003BEF6D4D
MKIKSVLLHQYENVSANLLWCPPLPEECSHLLKSSLELLQSKGYWVSPFPEGDGLTINNKTYDPKIALNDLKLCFEWLEIDGPSGNAQEAVQQLHAGRMVRVRYLVPVDKLLQWPDIVELGPYNIHRPVIPRERPVNSHPWGRSLSDIEGIDMDTDWNPFTAPAGSLAQLLAYPLIEGVTEVDASLFFPVGAGTCEYEPLVLQITEHADRVLDVLRHIYCHYRTPHYTPNHAGVIAGKEFRTAFLMPETQNLKWRKVTAKGQVFEANNVWLGLELDNSPSSSNDQLAEIASGIVANEVEGHIRSALRMRGQSFFLLNDEMRFLSLVFTIDACTFVGKKNGPQHRQHIAAFASGGNKFRFDEYLNSFDQLYKIRNKIVHSGSSFAELRVNAKDQLTQIDHILFCCIEQAVDESWTTEAEVNAAIKTRLTGFGC